MAVAGAGVLPDDAAAIVDIRRVLTPRNMGSASHRMFSLFRGLVRLSVSGGRRPSAGGILVQNGTLLSARWKLGGPYRCRVVHLLHPFIHISEMQMSGHRECRRCFDRENDTEGRLKGVFKKPRISPPALFAVRMHSNERLPRDVVGEVFTNMKRGKIEARSFEYLFQLRI